MRNILDKIVNWYFTKESLPFWCILLVDSVIIFISGLFSYWLFNKMNLLIANRVGVSLGLLVYTAISWIGFRLFHTYSGIFRFSSFVDLLKVAYGNAVSLAISVLLSLTAEQLGIQVLTVISQSELLVTFIVATMLMWGIRIIIKSMYDVASPDRRQYRALIYGALSGGVGLAKNIRSQRPRKFVLRGFISHDSRAKHIRLMGLKVYNINENLSAIIRKEHIDAVLVSPLRVSEFRDNQEIQNLIINTGCQIFMAQNVKEASVKNGQLTEEDIEGMQLKEVSVEDLLPRSEIDVDMYSIGRILQGRRILVTGSAGSIGSEMVRQIATFRPEAMMLIDQAETPQHDIRLMMARDYPDVKAETIVTSICKEGRMEYIFREFRPDYVFHAAAYKHVPMMEDNPSEAVWNNVHGTMVIADLSVKYGVEKFVMVSTDKAVNPTNVMGCSKRICEIYVQSLNRKLKIEAMKNLKNSSDFVHRTQFVTTRFGNVLGSNGSVIPLFKEQIKNGGPVTVTDERIVRFFMLIPEACKLVLEAGTKGNGGEIFVFDMGQPVKIADLAKRMIMLSNAKNVEIKYTGLRDGEKLYEEVLNELEGTKPTFHEKIRIAQVREYDFEEVSKEIDNLILISKQYDDMATVAKMKAIVPEYKSNHSKYEKLDNK